MENKKLVLVIIIILLCIFIPLTVGGIVLRVKGYATDKTIVTDAPKNPNKDFKKDQYLYFYNNAGKLSGTYKCKNNIESCDYAVSYIDDDAYGIKYYNNDTDAVLKVYNEKFAFIKELQEDLEIIYLVDIKTGDTMGTFSAVKNYQIEIQNDYFIVQNLANNKWGVISLADNTVTQVIPTDYDFIGLNNNVFNNKLVANMFIVRYGNSWRLLSKDNKTLTSNYANPIVDYNNKYVVSMFASTLYLYDYQNNAKLTGVLFSEIILLEDYVAVVDSESNLYLVNPEDGLPMSEKIAVASMANVTAKLMDEDNVIFTINGEERVLPIIK